MHRHKRRKQPVKRLHHEVVRKSVKHHDFFKESHGVAHLAYFGAVAYEAHGLYGAMGGILLGLGVLGLLIGRGVDS